MVAFNKVNKITGWVVFAIAAFTYLCTLEPTASLWDCGEFIATGYKLEIGHPPGCAIFMILTRLFTLFAGGDVSKVALMANALSAFASAFTILFLFWTITHLAKKIITTSDDNISIYELIAIMGAGVVGALAYAFSDSFWFSAVEGEVYATSSLFTAIVFWAILKWEECTDDAESNRWIILVFFLMGISISVHLLNLLALPAIFLVWYFKKRDFSWKGFIVTILISFVTLAIIIWGIIPGTVTLSTYVDKMFVNTLGLPVNSGMIFHVILLFGMMFYAVYLSTKETNPSRLFMVSITAIFLTGLWILSGNMVVNIIILLIIAWVIWKLNAKSRRTVNFILTSLLVLLIGYSSTAIIVIRASANTPLNENNPSNPYSLLYYLNREQYGSSPLLKGPYYNAPVVDYKDTDPVYKYDGEQYVLTHYNFKRVYDERFTTILPRMWSTSPNHIDYYKSWGGTNGKKVTVTDRSTGEKVSMKVPSFADNLRFMFSYQMGYMYMRYFMWNFSGKQNDSQGSGGSFSGNWITGFNFIDKYRIGSSENLPEELKNDTSRNAYYLIPFILGIIGLFYQLFKDNKNWWVVLFLFVMTGIAIVLYLNQYPEQPRERDYAYVGSFYFYSIWIGLSVLALYDGISYISNKKIAAPIATALALTAPILMGTQNWDDHDRSGRYLTRDVAFNYLESCAPNAILFSNGDNDTFPLWYAQEVEGKRTDIRVCNLMLLNTDWYINQMKRKVYESDPLPITLPEKKYYEGINGSLYVLNWEPDTLMASEVINWIANDDKRTKAQTSSGENVDIIPTKTIRIPVDADKVIAAGIVGIEDSAKIVPYIDIDLGSSILKNQLILIDILAHNDWKRPIYFLSAYNDDVMGLEPYLRNEGFAYRLIPIKGTDNGWSDFGTIDTEILYDNMMNKFSWGGANDPKVNLDYSHQRNLAIMRARLNYTKLAKALASEGKYEKAVEVLDRCLTELPLERINYDSNVAEIVDAYFMANEETKALDLVSKMCDHYYEEIEY
ncbi:MAG: DUF2723 domain-containing protein [Bacteroidales bacterium]|nr:DUF2723 domain-containing protein [Bacteroidales bacterium]